MYTSSIVVANANAMTTFFHLVPSGVLDDSFLEAINALKVSKSEAVVNIGVDLDLSALSSIVRITAAPTEEATEGKKFSFFINSNADSSMAPSGCASVSYGVSASYAQTPPIGTVEYEQYKDRLLRSAIEQLGNVIPGIRGHIIVADVITPRTYESYTSMPEGAIYAFDQSKGSNRPYFKTPIIGLYLASASTYPGAGVEAVVASGLICARDIISNKKSPRN
jgi:all-trans-retinol 13,14-reductase